MSIVKKTYNDNRDFRITHLRSKILKILRDPERERDSDGETEVLTKSEIRSAPNFHPQG